MRKRREKNSSIWTLVGEKKGFNLPKHKSVHYLDRWRPLRIDSIISILRLVLRIGVDSGRKWNAYTLPIEVWSKNLCNTSTLGVTPNWIMTEYIIVLQYSSSISKFDISVWLLNEENKKIKCLLITPPKIHSINCFLWGSIGHYLPAENAALTQLCIARMQIKWPILRLFLLDRRSLLDHHLQEDTSRYNLCWETEMECSGISTQA